MKPTAIILSPGEHPHGSSHNVFTGLVDHTSGHQIAFSEITDPTLLAHGIANLPVGLPHRLIAPEDQQPLLKNVALQLQKAGHVVRILDGYAQVNIQKPVPEKRYTLDFTDAPIEPLDGIAHIREALIQESAEQLVFQNIGPRVIAVLGFESRDGLELSSSQKIQRMLGKKGRNILKKIGVELFRKEHFIFSVTPGKIDEISVGDTDLMEQALRDVLASADYLLGKDGSIRLFQTVKDRALESPIIHTELYEKLVNLLLSHGLKSDQIAQFAEESKKDKHPWNEIIANIFQTGAGREFWKTLRPLYLERKRQEEEYELAEFRAIHRRFQEILSTLKPSQIFIGTTSLTSSRLEIIARHLMKTAGDHNALFGKQSVQPLQSIEKVLLDEYNPVHFIDANI